MPLSIDLEIARNLPPAGCDVATAEHYTHWLATHHYENFHIVSWLLPRRLHQHFYNVYAYCRWADDLGDEVPDQQKALELLDDWERELDACYAGRATHPVFIALAPTIRALDIPAEPFRDLLTAFRQDQVTPRYQSWDAVLGYCRYSANPVGRLVLYLCGYRDADRQELSDATCTALQLANFWQDVGRDLEKGRIYIPRDLLEAHGLDFDDVVARRFDARYVGLMQELIARTRALFARGLPLVDRVDAALRVDLDLFSRGGMAVLDAIEASGYNTLARRPAIGAAVRLRLLARALAGRTLAPFAAPFAEKPQKLAPFAAQPRSSGEDAAQPQTPSAPASSSLAADASPSVPARPLAAPPSPAVAASYDECRRIARASASNFYYAFYMLPRPKRDALCALYAFNRLVDDVVDSQAEPGADATAGLREDAIAGVRESAVTGVREDAITKKRAGLARWRAWLDEAAAGDTSGHPILPAFADTMSRYAIPPRYFHDLISGAEMDITEVRYATFERLREYCYRVAGTVGLTCIHVFGFSDPRALELAEQLGIAFQLTNILRDVPGDLALGRVYLPADEMARFGCTIADLGSAGPPSASVRELLRFEANRAWQFYAQGAGLVPKIDRNSRAALWALVRTYSTLLVRIEECDFDVFSARVRLTAAEKARILLRASLGWWSESDVLEDRNRDRRRPGGNVLRRRAG